MRRNHKLMIVGSFSALGLAGPAGAVLTHHFTFDNADIVGTKGAADIVGSADALPTGALGGTNITTGLAGIFGQAYAFTRDGSGNDGSTGSPGDASDYENLLRTPAGTAPFGSSERTIALWFNQTADDPASQDKIFGYGGPNTDGIGSTAEALDVSLEAGGIRIRNSSGNITYGSGFDFDGIDSGWHHLALRVNAGASTYADIDVFLDGIQLNPVDAFDPDLGDSLSIPDSPFGIGNIGYDAFLNNGFNGLIDDLRIYDNAISNDEVAQLALPPGAVIGDTDGDGDIDGSDMLNALSGFTGSGGIGGTVSSGDTDNDGDVDQADITFLINNYTAGPQAAAVSVPDPASAFALSLGVLVFSSCRRRVGFAKPIEQKPVGHVETCHNPSQKSLI